MTVLDQRLTPKAQRIERTLLKLRSRAMDLGLLISADDRISEAAAARLLDVHTDTLAKRRKDGTGPIAYERPLRKAKWSYELSDIAIWLVGGRGSFYD